MGDVTSQSKITQRLAAFFKSQRDTKLRWDEFPTFESLQWEWAFLFNYKMFCYIHTLISVVQGDKDILNNQTIKMYKSSA